MNSFSSPARLASPDILRGSDMLIIIGLDALIICLSGLFPASDFMQEAKRQMHHATWEGLRIYDMVFPIFVFVAGIGLHLSQQRSAAGTGRRLLKLWRRAVVLTVLGWAVNGAIVWDPAHMRYASVLGLIGISGALAGTLLLLIRDTRVLIAVTLIILGSVWSAQHFCGDITPAGCVNALLDSRYLPGILHNGSYDPEGLLCIVSATALTLGGVLCGRLITGTQTAAVRVVLMLAVGIGLIAGGMFGHCIKNIWTPSFVLLTAGTGFILMGILHLTADVWGLSRWAAPLRVIGRNALLIYLIVQLLPVRGLTEHLFGGTVNLLLPAEWHASAVSALVLLLLWLLCLFFYRRGIFLKA